MRACDATSARFEENGKMEKDFSTFATNEIVQLLTISKWVKSI